jgi:hypothetical protein
LFIIFVSKKRRSFKETIGGIRILNARLYKKKKNQINVEILGTPFIYNCKVSRLNLKKTTIFFIQKALARPRQPFCHSSLDVFSLAANAKNSVAESRVVRNDKQKQNVVRDVTRKPKLKIDDVGQ